MECLVHFEVRRKIYANRNKTDSSTIFFFFFNICLIHIYLETYYTFFQNITGFLMDGSEKKRNEHKTILIAKCRFAFHIWSESVNCGILDNSLNSKKRYTLSTIMAILLINRYATNFVSLIRYFFFFFGYEIRFFLRLQKRISVFFLPCMNGKFSDDLNLIL